LITLRTDELNVQSFKLLPSSLEALHLPISNENASVQQLLADALQKLPRLSNLTFEVPRRNGDELPPEDSEVVWTLPELLYCGIKRESRSDEYSFMGQLIAPNLATLDAHVNGESMAQLLANCPSVTSLHGRQDFFPHIQTLAVLTGQIEKGAWRNIKEFITQRSVLTESAVIAISRNWTSLKKLSVFLSRNSATTCGRLLLTSLPQLRVLRLERSDLVSESATIMNNFIGSSAPHALSKLQILRLDFADDETFAGLSFPKLNSLHMAHMNVQLKDISAVLSSCPKLEILELRNCPWITTSKTIKLPALHHLVMTDLPEITDAACGIMLSGLPQTSEDVYKIEIDKCHQLSEISLATLVSLGLQLDELTFKLVRPIRFSALVQPMLCTLINNLHVSNIHLSIMPENVRNALRRQFGSRLRYNTRSGDYLNITENGQQLRVKPPTQSRPQR